MLEEAESTGLPQRLCANPISRQYKQQDYSPGTPSFSIKSATVGRIADVGPACDNQFRRLDGNNYQGDLT